MKTAWCFHKNWRVDQWNRIEGAKTTTGRVNYLIFDKAEKNIGWKKDSLFIWFLIVLMKFIIITD